jgi:hypothetical protein
MKYAVQMGSSAMKYMPIFIEIGSGMNKIIVGIHRHTGSFEQNKESRIKTPGTEYVTVTQLAEYFS